MLITTLPSDADNVFILLIISMLNHAVIIIARASDENSVSKLYRSGATHVIITDNLGGLYMTWLITKPYVIGFLDLLSGFDVLFVLEEFITKNSRMNTEKKKSDIWESGKIPDPQLSHIKKKDITLFSTRIRKSQSARMVFSFC